MGWEARMPAAAGSLGGSEQGAVVGLNEVAERGLRVTVMLEESMVFEAEV